MKVGMLRATVFLYLLFQSTPSAAQQNFSVEHYTAENGLPQNSVKNISADRQGFVWLATEDGLTRFDGHNFLVFNKDNLDVSSTRIMNIEPYLRNSSSKKAIPDDGQISVAYAKTAADEVLRIENGKPVRDTTYSPSRRKDVANIKKVTPKIHFSVGLPDPWNSSPLTGSILIPEGSQERNFYVCDYSTATYYYQAKKKYVVTSKANDLWRYFTLAGKLYYYNDDGTFVQISNNRRSTFRLDGAILQNPDFKNNPCPTKIYWNTNSDQAYFLVGKKLYFLEYDETGQLTSRLLVTDFDFISNAIDVVYYDKRNSKLFLGSRINGLFILSIHRFETITISGLERTNVFYAHIPYDSNSVLTPTGIIAGRDKKTATIIDRRLPTLEKINPGDKHFMYRDREGHLWVKSVKTLYKLGLDNKTVLGQWHFDDEVKAVHQVDDTHMWIGIMRMGLYKLDITNAKAVPEFFEGEYSKWVTCFGSERENQLLVGTNDGLYRFDTRTGKIAPVPGVQKVYIKSIHRISNEQSWVTALEKGLILINSKKGAVTFPLDKGKYLASPHCAVEDERGYLWIPTNRGLFQIKITDLLSYADIKFSQARIPKNNHETEASLFYFYHAQNEGFNTNEFNGNCSPCGVKLANGYISFPSLNGLVWFKSEQMSPNVPDGGIILDEAFANRAKIDFSGDTVRLPLKPENIRLQFSTAYFGNNYNLHISYALVRQGEKVAASAWQPIDDDHAIIIRYSSLSSGRHSLLVRKEAGFGLNNAVTREIHLIVPAPWYENRWLHLLSGFLLLAFAAALWRLRFRKLETRNQHLEMQVAARTDELRQTLFTLETSQDELLRQFHLQSRLLTSMAHDLRSPLSAAMLVTGEVGRLIGRQENEKAIFLNQQLEDAVGLIKQSIDELLTYIKVQVYSKEVKMEEVALANMIDKSFRLYAKTARINSNAFKNNVPRNITVFTNPQLLDVLIRNLTDNANKFTENGIVSARWGQTDASPSLIIQDTGKGLPASLSEWLKKKGPSPVPENMSGLGLMIVKELAPFAMIRLSIHSDNDGTQVRLIFSNPNSPEPTQ